MLSRCIREYNGFDSGGDDLPGYPRFRKASWSEEIVLILENFGPVSYFSRPKPPIRQIGNVTFGVHKVNRMT